MPKRREVKNEDRPKPNAPVLIGTGLIALDVIIYGNQYQLSRRWAGGTCGNVSIILSYLGWNAFPVSRLNGETASRRVLRDLKRWNVNLDFAKSVPRVNTPIIIHKILADKSGEPAHRFSLRCPNCGAWLPRYMPITSAAAQRVATKIKDPAVFFFDRVSRASITLAEACANKGAIVFFEPSGVGDPRLFREALSVAHIIKYSRERIPVVREIQPNRALLEIQTLGEEGLRYRSKLRAANTSDWHHLDGCKVTTLKDTAGAGDWCTAGIIYQLGAKGLVGLETTTEHQLLNGIRFGQALAAWTCKYEGARGGMYEVDRATFRKEVGELVEQFGSFNTALGQDQSTGLDASGLNPQGLVSGTRMIRIPIPAQDACCF